MVSFLLTLLTYCLVAYTQCCYMREITVDLPNLKVQFLVKFHFCLSPTANLTIARQKQKQAETNTDIQTESESTENMGRGKRKRR